MNLSEFILNNMDAILAEWESFAQSLPVGECMSSAALRNDAERMLRFIAADMNTAQTDQEQRLKSQGRAPPLLGESAAHDHGSHRLQEGFNLNELIAEYRAIRATVLRLWAADADTAEQSPALRDLIRFNEAVDQSIAESVVRFSGDMDRARDILLAVLGHDLRNPISAIAMSSKWMLTAGDLAEGPVKEATQRIERSAERTLVLVRDVLDFTRTRLGAALPVDRSPCDLGAAALQAIEELRVAYPSRQFNIAVTGDLKGCWDCARLTQLVSNLVGNALQHGDEDSPVTVTTQARPDDVQLTVHNRGPVIPAHETRTIFDPLVRAHRFGPDRSGSLGLGLYIARQIAVAHGGQVDVRSSDETGTCLALVIPRAKPSA